MLARARAIYLGDEDERWEDIKPRNRPCAGYMVGAIKRLTATASADNATRSVTLHRTT